MQASVGRTPFDIQRSAFDHLNLPEVLFEQFGFRSGCLNFSLKASAMNIWMPPGPSFAVVVPFKFHLRDFQETFRDGQSEMRSFLLGEYPSRFGDKSVWCLYVLTS